MTEAELHQAIEEVLAAKMHDLEEKHQHLQAAHRQLRLDNESLEAVIEQCNLAVTIARRDVHRLEAQLCKFKRRPLLTRQQRQQLQILKQTRVSIEVLRRGRFSVSWGHLSLKALPPIGKEYQQGYKRVNDWLPKVKQRLRSTA
ncbi:hypothetical protein QJQ45_023149, partial [Haematococcus lacustris]